jgi:hypothetical protein
VNWDVVESDSKGEPLLWKDLANDVREALTGKLSGLWEATSDEAAFNGCTVDKQQTLLIMVSRLRAKGLWHVIKKIENVYGEGGVGIGFAACSLIDPILQGRKDFTRFLANHKDTIRGFYERGRGEAVLHFLYVDEEVQKWYVHFDLYSPVHSPVSAFRHLRYEFLGKLRPDWRTIQDRLGFESALQIGV